MPKSNQKTAGADQPANQRGKSRFGASGRPARVVLPERPPRAVDNEIVSILLGADPAALATQAEAVKSDAPVESMTVSAAPVPVIAPITPPVDTADAPTEIEPTPAGEIEPTVEDGQGTSEVSTIVEATGLIVDSAAPAEATAPLTAPSNVVTPQPARPRRVPTAPATPRAAKIVEPAAQPSVSLEVTVSSFEEFAERWKHGLRKGQLKICEVLYQKTYAVGRTECVTSFSELGRLSGLKMRQCFNIIAQLEALKFVERSRSESTSNKKDQGSVICFHLYPIQ